MNIKVTLSSKELLKILEQYFNNAPDHPIKGTAYELAFLDYKTGTSTNSMEVTLSLVNQQDSVSK